MGKKIDEKELMKAFPDSTPLMEEFKNEITEEKIIEDAELDRKKGAVALFDPQEIDLKTELNQFEIMKIAQLSFMAERYKSKNIKHFLQHFLRLKVSKDRKGRREFIEGLHAEERSAQNQSMGPLQKILNSFGGGNG